MAKNRLKQLREAKGLTVRQLAKLTDSAKSTLSRYENADGNLDVSVAYRLSKQLGTSIEYLIGESDDRMGSKEENREFFANEYIVPLCKALGIEI